MAPKAKRQRMIVFEITTPSALPVGDQVFVSGDHPVLGQWRADGLPLTRMDERLWTGSAMVPIGVPVSFKVTRGSWETEAVDAEGNVPPNTEVPAEGTPCVKVQVERWKDG